MKKRIASIVQKAGTMGGVFLSGLFTVAKPVSNKLKMFYMETMYKLHLRVRYAHDVLYEKNRFYKNYSDKPWSSKVHKATVWAFIASFTMFTFLQYIAPEIFNLGAPNKVYAGSNTKTWTTRGDFAAGNYDSNITLSGVNPGDDSSAGLTESMSFLKNYLTKNTPENRSKHTAVWTGTKMIVWGGYNGLSIYNTGGVYDPSNDTWTATSTLNAPVARANHTAVWTGTKMIVWGGFTAINSAYTNTGGIYDPATDTWTSTSVGTDVPTARDYHTAVWTGTKMIVWGGGVTNTGGVYDPGTDTWTATSTGANVPTARNGHTSVWSGTKMIVWGGVTNGSPGTYYNTGGVYDPSANTWTATSTGANAPTARNGHTAVWSGTKMIVWGGTYTSPSYSTSYYNDGGVYDPSANTWTATSVGTNVPTARYFHTAVWTGTKMIVWSGTTFGNSFKDGGIYDLAGNSWTATSVGANVPSIRNSSTAVWTGTKMVVWGGYYSNYFNSGGVYDPTGDTWTATSRGGAPVERTDGTAIWTGSKLIVWGGIDSSAYQGGYLNTGGVYDSATDTWTAMSTNNAPTARRNHTAIWTGSKMIVWGGRTATSTYVNTGGVYDPTTDTWTATSVGANVPSIRLAHTAIWTGTKMIVWGGIDVSSNRFNNGGAYDPVADSWTPTSVGSNVPAGRNLHSAIWTGTKMIVWGGLTAPTTYANTGGVYDPGVDSWTATSVGTNVPAARNLHSAVWTGTRMIIWGGANMGSKFNTGGAYDPSADSWTATSVGTNVPAGRDKHTAVWTGTKMIVWGGFSYSSNGYNDGGIYDPGADSWVSTSTTNAPSGRYYHSAFWSGTNMIIWGGTNNNATYGSGGIYGQNYPSSSVLSNLLLDTSAKAKWSSISWSGTVPAGTAIKFRTRGSNVAPPVSMTGNADTGWTYWNNDVTGATYYTSSGSSVITPNTRWLEAELTLVSTNNVATPTLDYVSVSYDALEAPLNSNLTLKRADNTTFKTSTGVDITAGIPSAWSNQTSLRVEAAGLTCGGGVSGNPACGVASTNLRPELEIKATGTGFDGSTGLYTATAGNSYVDIPNLTVGTGYHIQVRAIDDQGRVSAWTSYGANAENEADVTVEQTTPTGTVSINAGATYASSTSATLTLSASDAGGSNTAQMRFSNDGTTWSTWEAYVADRYDGTPDFWALSTGEGTKTVYAQFKDNAGNVSGTWTQTSKAEFDTGTKNSTATTSPGEIKLGATPSSVIVRPNGPGLYTQWWQVPGAGAHWDKVDEASADDADYVYIASLDQKDMYTVTASGVPAGATIDSVSITGRFADNFQDVGHSSYIYGLRDGIGEWWGSGEIFYDYVPGWSEDTKTKTLNPRTSAPWTITEINNLQIGIMCNSLDDAGACWYSQLYATVNYSVNATSGNFISATKDNTTAQNYGKITWSADVPSQTGADALRFQVASNNNNSTWDYIGPDGTAGTYYSTSATQLHSSHNGNRYIRYKAYLQTADTSYTPTVYDVTIEINNTISDSITLDTVPPANVADLKAYTDSGKGTEITNNTWHDIVAPYFEWTANGDSDLASYKYCFDTNLSCSPTTSLGTTNHYTVTPDISLEGIHYFKVIATDLAGQNSVTPSVFTYKYDATIPGAITGLTATKTDINKIRVSWTPYSDPASPVEDYKLERVKDTGNEYQIGDTWTGHEGYAAFILTSTPFDDTPGVPVQGQSTIDQSTQYQYRISVRDISNPEYSAYQIIKVYGMTDDLRAPDPVSVTTPGSAACDGTGGDVPNTSTPKCSDVANNGFEITVVWNPTTDSGSGIAGYNVYRSSTGAVGSYENIGTTIAITNFYHDNDTSNTDPAKRLNDYTTYYYRITAFDASSHANETDILAINNPSINATSTSTPDVTAPTVPSGLVATPMGIDPNPPTSLPEDPVTDPQDPIYHQRIHLAWDASTDFKARSQEIVPGDITYNVFRSLTLAGTYSQIGSTTNLEYDVDQLQEFTNYYFKISAVDSSTAHNQSAQSSSGTAMTASNSVPIVPTNVTVTSKKGNPTDTEVGHKVTVTFKGSYAKNCLNSIRCLTKYEVYRSETNWGAGADWLNPAKATKVDEKSAIVTHDDRDTTYTYDDTGLNDATTYFYKVRAHDNTPASPDGGPFVSGLSGVTAGTLHQGWDITPDVTAPVATADGMAIKVKDTYPKVDKVRNVLTWLVPSVPSRNSIPDFGKYEIWRELRDADDVMTEAKLADITDFDTNMYIDEADRIFEDFQFKYYILVFDNAGTDYKYADASVINPTYSNKSAKIYSGDSIIPTKSHAVISSVALANVNVSSATITWNTDQDTDSLVEYRPMKLVSGSWAVDDSNEFTAVGHRERAEQHSVYIFSLKPNTKYEYRVVSKNYPFANETVADTSLPVLTTAGFNLTTGETISTTSTAEINWTTNLDASSAFVEYQLQRQPGDDPQGGTAGVEPAALSTSPRNHMVVVKGLRSARTYTYKIKSISTDGYVTETEFLTFRTRAYDSAQFTLAPASSNVAERNITATTAQIVWQTESPTTSWVDYSTKSGIYDNAAGNNDLVGIHVVVIEGLVPGTKYYYRVRVKDANEVEYTSQEYSFTAVLKPKISNMTVKDVTPYSVTVAWDTNVDTETIINWGTTSAYGEKKGKSGTSKVHELKIDGLLDNQEYHYQILASDEAGNEVADVDKIVRTPLDTEGPKITGVKIDVLPMGENDTTSSIIVSWQTNKPATTLVEYDEGVIGGSYSKSSIEDTSLNASHTVIVKDLKPASSYHYRLVSSDKRQNKTTSQDYTFVTPSKEKSILQLILKSLEETFAWTRNLNQFFGNIGKRMTGK